MAGELSFVELGTADVKRAHAFCGELFGWTFESHRQGAVIHGAGVGGGIHGGDEGASPYDQGSGFGLHQPPAGD